MRLTLADMRDHLWRLDAARYRETLRVQLTKHQGKGATDE